MLAEIMGEAFLKEIGPDGRIPEEYADDPRLALFSYRIPNSSKKLMAPVRIAKVLPKGYGSGIMLPAELAVQMGSDYDVDKLYVVRPEVDKDGNVVPYDLNNLGEESDKGLNNAILDMMTSALNNTEQFGEMSTALTTDPLKRRKDEMIDIYEQEGTSNVHMFSPGTNLKYESLNKFGAKGIGISANFSSAHTYFPQAGLKVIMESKLLQDKKAFNGSMNDVTTFNGNLILDNMEQWQNAFLDNAKDLIAGYLNVNGMTVNPMMTLLAMGYDNDTVIDLINQPILRALSKEFDKTGETNFDVAVTKLKEQTYSIVPKTDARKATDPVEIDGDKLHAALNNKDFSEYTPEEMQLQLDVLTFFQELHGLSRSVSNATLALKPDGAKSLTTQAQLEEHINKIENLGNTEAPVHFEDINTLFNENINPRGTVLTEDMLGNPLSSPIPKLATMYKAAIIGNHSLSKFLFPYSTKAFMRAKSQIAKELGFDNLRADQIEILNNSMFMLLASNALEETVYKGQNWDKLLYDKDNSLAKQLYALRKSHPDLMANDPLFRSISPSAFNDYTVLQEIYYNNGAARLGGEKNMITDAWAGHLRSPDPVIKRFAERLVGYSIITSGFQMHKGSFVDLVPNFHFESNGFVELYREAKGGDENYNLQNIEFFDNHIEQLIRSTIDIIKPVKIEVDPGTGRPLTKSTTPGFQTPIKGDINDNHYTTIRIDVQANTDLQRKDVKKGAIEPITYIKAYDYQVTGKNNHSKSKSMHRLYKLDKVAFNASKGTVAVYNEIQALGEPKKVAEASYSNPDLPSSYPKNKGVTSVKESSVKSDLDMTIAQQGDDYDDGNYGGLDMDAIEANSPFAALRGTAQAEKVNKEVHDSLVEFANKMGFNVQVVDSLMERFGIDAMAAADMMNKIILLSDTDEGMRSLPEEVAHVYVEALQDHKAVRRLMESVERTPEYKEVLEKYSEVYGGDQDMLRKEAAGKIIAKHIIKGEKAPKNWLMRQLNNIKNLIKKTFGYGDPFKMAAEAIINHDMGDLSTDLGTNQSIYYNQGVDKEAITDSLKESGLDVSGDGVDIDALQDSVAELEGYTKKGLTPEQQMARNVTNAQDNIRALVGNAIYRLSKEGRVDPTKVKELKAIQKLLNTGNGFDFVTSLAAKAAGDLDEINNKFNEYDFSVVNPEDAFEHLKELNNWGVTLPIYSGLIDLEHSIITRTNSIKEIPESQRTAEEKIFMQSTEKVLAQIHQVNNSVAAAQARIEDKEQQLFIQAQVAMNTQERDAQGNIVKKGLLEVGADGTVNKNQVDEYIKSTFEERENDIGWASAWVVGLHEHSDALLSFIGERVKVAEGKAHRKHMDWLNSRGAHEEFIKAQRADGKTTMKEIYGDLMYFHDTTPTSTVNSKTGKLVKAKKRGTWHFVSDAQIEPTVRMEGFNAPGTETSKYDTIMKLDPTHPTRKFYEAAVLPYIEQRREIHKESPEKLNRMAPTAIPTLKKRTFEKAVDDGSASDVFEGIKDYYKEQLTVEADDDSFGAVDAEGKPLKAVPYRFNNSDIGPDEISMDIFSGLNMAMANIYTAREKEEVLPLFKVALNIIANKRRIMYKSDSGKRGEKGKQGSQSLAHKKLLEMRDILMYGETRLENNIKIEVGGKKVSIGKLADTAKKKFSFINLAFNVSAMIMNPLVQMYFITSAAIGGVNYKPKTLWNGYNHFKKNAAQMALEYQGKNPKNKLTLLMERLDIFNDGMMDLKYGLKGNFFNGFFNKLGYMGFKIGNSMTQPALATGMMMDKTFEIDGKEMSFLDAWTKNKNGNLEIDPRFEAALDKEWGGDGVIKFQNAIKYETTRIADINKASDKGMYQKHAIGRLIAMHRSWMVPLALNIWGGHRFNPITQKPEEGSWKTALKVVQSLVKGGDESGGKSWTDIKNIMITTSKLEAGKDINPSTDKPFTEDELALYKGNMKQFMAQFAFGLATMLGAAALDDEELKDNYGYFLYLRMKSEAFALMSPKQLLKTVQSPTAAIRSVENLLSASWRLVPYLSDGSEIVQSGRWKGYSRRERDWLKMAPGYNHLKNLQNIEDQIKFMTSSGR
jgi:hypothetical protein